MYGVRIAGWRFWCTQCGREAGAWDKVCKRCASLIDPDSIYWGVCHPSCCELCGCCCIRDEEERPRHINDDRDQNAPDYSED